MKRIRQNYHWVIAALAFLEMIIFGGLLNSMSVFIIPITESLGVSRGSFALASMPYSILGTIGTLFSGLLYQKVGYKRCMIIGLLITIVSAVLTAVCQDLYVFALGKALLGVSYSVCCIAGAVYIVKNWFYQRQGLVMGLVSMSSALGGSLMILLLTRLTEALGWRIAHVFLAVVCGAIALLYGLLMKDRPEDMGLMPYGYGQPSENTGASTEEDGRWPGLTFQQWLRRPLLYMMTLATLASCLGMYLTSSILVPHFQDQGLSPAVAAEYQSTFMLALSVSILVSGAATDRMDVKPVSIFCMVCTVLGQFLLRSTVDPVMCYLGVSLCGIGLSMTVVMISLLAMSLFGYRAIDDVNSIVLSMPPLACIFAGPISNLVFDKLGTYSPVFLAAAILNAVMILVYLLMFAMAKKERKRMI